MHQLTFARYGVAVDLHGAAQNNQRQGIARFGFKTRDSAFGDAQIPQINGRKGLRWAAFTVD